MLVLPTLTPVTPNVTVLLASGMVATAGAVATLGSIPERVTRSPDGSVTVSAVVMLTLTVRPTPGAICLGLRVSTCRTTGTVVLVGIDVLVMVGVGVLVLVAVGVLVDVEAPVLVGVGVLVLVGVGVLVLVVVE